MADEDEQFEQAYPDDSSVKLVLEFDGTNFTLKLKGKKIPGVGQAGQISAKKTGRKYVFDFGLGDKEFDEKDLPNPIKKLIDSKGGGPSGHQVKFPPRKDVITEDYTIRPYPEYASRWQSRSLAGKEKMERPLTERLYLEIARLYLDLLGVPLYI